MIIRHRPAHLISGAAIPLGLDCHLRQVSNTQEAPRSSFQEQLDRTVVASSEVSNTIAGTTGVNPMEQIHNHEDKS